MRIFPDTAPHDQRIPFVLWMLGAITLFAPVVDGGTTHYPVFLIRLALIVTGAAVLIDGMKRGEIGFPRNAHVFLAVALLTLSGLSLMWVPYLSGGLQWVTSLATYTLFFVLLIRKVNNRHHLRLLFLVLCGMGITEALLGVTQYVWLGYPRAQGTFFNPNFFATYTGAISLIALGALVFSSPVSRSVAERLLLWTTVGTTGLAFVLAQSRGAMVAFLCSIGVVGFIRFGKQFGLVMTSLLVILILVPNPIRQRAVEVSAHDPYAYARLDIWASSLKRIVDQPFGVGAGMYKYTSFAYRFPIEQDVARFGKRAESAHNEYLQLMVELGIPAILIVGTALVLWIKKIKGLLQEAVNPSERGMVVGLAAGTTVILAHAAVDSIFHEPALMLLLVLMGSMVFPIQSQFDRVPRCIRIPFPYQPTQFALVLVGALLAAVLVARPAAAWYVFETGEEAYRAGRITEAITAFARASMIDPGVTGYYDTMARALVRSYEQSGDSRQLAAAIDELKIACSLNGQDARFPARLGLLNLMLAQQSAQASERERYVTEAAAAYDRAIRLDPYTAAHYYDFAKVRLAQNNEDEARRLLREAVAYEPNYLPARALLVELAVRTGDSALARAEYNFIVAVQAKYAGRPLNALEREFLNVDAARVGRLVAAQPAA